MITNTVARYVQMRAAGQPPDRRRHRARAIDDFLPKIEELVVRSQGKVRADVIHERIVALGFTGGERTTRRTVAEAKAQFRAWSAASVSAVGNRTWAVVTVRLR